MQSESTRRHGYSSRRRCPEYDAWRDIKQRCLNENDSQYRDYGGRGITVCERWAASFQAFLDDVGRRPGRGYSIDRIDNDRGYEPGNVRWASPTQQQRNTRYNRLLDLHGERRCVSEWCELLGLNRNVVNSRLCNGWTVEDALTIPVQRGLSYRDRQQRR